MKPKQAKHMAREVNIRPVLNGFVCQVGCKTVVFQTTRELAVAVEEYFNHPDETEKRFIEKAVNKMEPRPAEPTGRQMEPERPYNQLQQAQTSETPLRR